MRKALNMLKLALIAIILINSYGCGNKNSSTGKVKPEKIEISGDLAKYLQVVDNEYEVTDNWGGNLSIKVKAIKQLSEYDLKGKDFELSASLLGDNGVPISGIGEFAMEYSSKDKLFSLLKNGTGEEIIQLKSTLGDYKAAEHADKIKKFVVSSTMKEKAKETESASAPPTGGSDNGSVSTDNSSSSDCDQFIRDYEAFADSYIRIMKKYKQDPSDMSILNEYNEIIQKASDMQTKASNCTDTKYTSKLMSIANRLATALQ